MEGVMGFLPEVELGETFWPFAFFRANFGFVPNLFRAQTLLPRVIEAEARMADAVLLNEKALSRRQKECILLAVSAAHRNTYCVTAHWKMLRTLGVADQQLRQMTIDHRRAGLSRSDVALLDFGLELTHQPTRVSRLDIGGLRQHGFSDEAILEAILTAAFTDFVCTLSEGLDAVPDFRPRTLASKRIPLHSNVRPRAGDKHEAPKPYLRAVELSPEAFAPFAFFKETFGFIPNIFRAQTLRPDVVEAEAEVIRTVLLTDDVLTRPQKEYILLVVSAANLNTYCVAVHCEMLRGLGVSEDESDQIAVNHRQAGLAGADTALLDFTLKLSQRPTEVGQEDIDRLRMHGFTDEQILESIVMTGLTSYLNTLQMGLGTVPDFEPRRVFGLQAGPTPKAASRAGDEMVSPLRVPARLKGVTRGPVPQVTIADPDADLVACVRGGDLGAFEELVRRHQRRIYRTLIGITGNAEDAEDGTQNAFLKAFERIGKFRGGAKFSTWLIRIAINEGIQRLRSRKRVIGLDDNGSKEAEEFRPRQVQAWDDNPEQLYSKAEMRELVERALMILPAGYRMVVMLRDIEQLTTEEAANALGLGVAALKSRLLRGRLMLREALAPHFIGRGKGRPRV
jgi:RNA polymerase sigma-70 factor (ECF subfamily)